MNANAWHKAISSPIACTTVTQMDASTKTGAARTEGTFATVLCPKNNVAAVDKSLGSIDTQRQTVTLSGAR